MSSFPSLYSIGDLNHSDIELLFKTAQKHAKGVSQSKSEKVAALVFFEPSTRTRFSFEIACQRVGVAPVVYADASSSSQTKGETEEETLHTILAMRPDLLIIRHKGQESLREIVKDAKVPYINAGDGASGHPTQALLDAMTMMEQWPSLKGKKLLIVGDVGSSRVAASHNELASRLNYELGICGPSDFLPQGSDWSHAEQFATLREGLKWCDVVMGLRVQKERHGKGLTVSQEDYVKNWRLDRESLASLGPQSLIMHPGPHLEGHDLHPEILKDPRCRIRQQVANGVHIRSALVALQLRLKV